MADLFISEFARLADGDRDFLQAPEAPPIASQLVLIAVGSTQSAALAARTRFVRLFAEAACSVEIGVNPTAVKATSIRMAAGAELYLGIPKELAGPGTCQIAVIQ